MGISRVILWMTASAFLLNEVSSIPTAQSVRGKRSGAEGHEEFWRNTKFMDNLGEYLTSNKEPKVQSHVPKPIERSNLLKSVNAPAALSQRADSSINMPSRSHEIASKSWTSYEYPSRIQQRPHIPSPLASSVHQSPNTYSPVNFRPSDFNSKSDHEASESILIPTITMYKAFKSLVGLATPSPTKAFSNLIIAKPYPSEEAVTAPSVIVNAVTFQPTTELPPPPPKQIVPLTTSTASTGRSNPTGISHPKEHKVLVFHLPPDMPIPPAFLQSSKKGQNITTQHVYFQKPQQSTAPPQVQQVPLSYIISENGGSQFSQPQQSVQVPLAEAFSSSQTSSGHIVSNVPYQLPVYSNYNPYTSASSSLSSLPSFGNGNVQNFAASVPQPQRQPYVPDQRNVQNHQNQHQHYPPTPFPIAIPHSHEQLAQFSNPNILIATAAPVLQQPSVPQGTSSPSSGFLEEENEVDKKPVDQQANMMGNLAEWIETGRKIMYFPKGVVDVVDKAVSYAEHNPYMGLVMDTVADKIFGSTKPLLGLQQQLQLALGQQGTQKQEQEGSQAV